MSADVDNTMRNLLVTRESRAPTVVALLVTVVMMGVTMVDFVGDLQATDAFTSTTPDWAITFDTQTHVMQAVETLQDDETKNVEFDLTEVEVPTGFKIGRIDVAILSEEQDGDDDWNQCDSIAGDINRNDFTAQWDDPSNNLSGQDSSCLPIELKLRVYPGFTGDSIAVSAKNEFQAMQDWTGTGWGEGQISIDLDLDVNTLLGLNTPTDTDEEITVEVTVVMFSASIQQV